MLDLTREPKKERITTPEGMNLPGCLHMSCCTSEAEAAVKTEFLTVPNNFTLAEMHSVRFTGTAGTAGLVKRCITARPTVTIYLDESAHTALAVKACLLGGNSNTKCSMTFVNIAVAISALAGGGPKTVSHRDQNTVVFSTFFEDFWVSERKRVLKWNFGSFW